MIVSLLRLRLKLLFNQRSFWFLYIGLVALIITMMVGLYQQVNQGLVIGIGVVNNGDTDYNETFIEKMQNEPSIHVTRMSRQEGEDALRDQRIEALYVLPEDMKDKMEMGNYEELFQMVYLADNAFAVMLTDIVTGIFLEESAKQTAARFYHDALLTLKDEKVAPVYNEVYEQSGYNADKETALKYLKISWKEKNMVSSGASRQVLLEKMTVGVIQILIGFFIVFAGMHLMGQESEEVRKRIYSTPVHSWVLQLSGWMVMILVGILAIVPMIVVGVYGGKGILHLTAVYGLYVMAVTGFVQGVMVIARKPITFVFASTVILMLMGMLSGSFYSVGSTTVMSGILSKIFPSFYAIESYFDKDYILEYSIYTSFYCCIMWIVHAVLERKAIEG